MTSRACFAAAASGLWFCAAASAVAATPVEGYHDAGDRVGCVMYQGFDRDGNAVKCGGRDGSRGLLLRSAGAATSRPWSWPARSLGDRFFIARYGQTLYLRGGTAKLDGDSSDLRCTFKRLPTARVKCRNEERHGIVVTRNTVRRIDR